MSDHVYALILAGGRGSRFWPLSRANMPKQCLKLGGKESLLARTVERIRPLVPAQRVRVMTGPAMEGPVRATVPALPDTSFLVEPSPRNTSPCISWGALEVAREAGEQAVVIVLPADHRIGREAEFRESLRQAIVLARNTGDLVTLGVRPDRPETGYGYLEIGAPLEGEPAGASVVTRFCEKPDLETARDWFADGRHLWNAGIFVFRVDALLRELALHLPDTAAALDQVRQDPSSLAEQWARMDATSIDYGLMERCSRIVTIPIEVEWSDLGDWDAVGRTLKENIGGRGSVAGMVAKDSAGCVVVAPGKVVALVGVEDLVLVDTPDAILLMHRSRAQQARDIPALLEAAGLDKATTSDE